MDTHQRMTIHHQTHSKEIQKAKRILCYSKNFKELEEEKKPLLPNGFRQVEKTFNLNLDLEKNEGKR